MILLRLLNKQLLIKLQLLGKVSISQWILLLLF